MTFLTLIQQMIQAWRDAWCSPLDDDETALGIEVLPLQGHHLIWVSLSGRGLCWLSGHRSREGAEAALLRVMVWARRPEWVDPVAHAVEMALLRENGDFCAQPPSERIQATILRRIQVRDPSLLIVHAISNPDADEAAPADEWAWRVKRATNQVKARQQLQALSQGRKGRKA